MKDGYFECTYQNCHNVEIVQVERGTVIQPIRCRKCESKNTMDLVHNLCSFVDKQFIKFQERPYEIPEGETPININLVVYDDLVD